jgi:hypothetical protein
MVKGGTSKAGIFEEEIIRDQLHNESAAHYEEKKNKNKPPPHF